MARPGACDRHPGRPWRVGFLGWSLSLLLLPRPAPAAVVPLVVPPTGRPGFTRLLPDRTGVTFTNHLADANAAANQIRLNGSGVALGDVDGDGRPDLFFCGLDGPNRLFINRGGLQFAERTADATLAMPGSFCSGAVLADVDGDGDSDLLVNVIGGGTRLLLNDGRGAFTPAPAAGLAGTGGPTTATLADVDGDGDLDLYVAHYRTTTVRTTGFAMHIVDGRPVVPPELREMLEITPEGRILEHGEPDVFYLNEGGGRFSRVAWPHVFSDEAGRPLPRAPLEWGLAAMFRDLNQDGAPDLYVANDFHSPDRMWINDGGGRFRSAPRLALRQTSTFSMSVDFADLDRDGWDDFLLADMLDPRRERRMAQYSSMEPSPAVIGLYDDRPQNDRNTLFRNRGDGTYAELAHFAGLEAAGWTWSAGFLDVDLDGHEDLLMTAGHMFDTQDLDAAARIDRLGPYRRDQIPLKLLQFPRLQMPKAAFRNLGGWRFADAAATWGFDDVGVAHGMAFADLDGDGDLEVVVNQLNGPAGIYRNDATAARVAVRLRGRPPNTAGIGARVSLHTDGLVQSQEVQAGGRYLSADDPLRVFAMPDPAGAGRLVVAWRSGRVSEVGGVRGNQLHVITEPETPPDAAAGLAARRPPNRSEPAWFVDASKALAHRHADAPFDDFARQPLLPRQFSQPGPGLAWLDLDGDGADDLAVGTGRGGRLAVRRNVGAGGFTPVLTNLPVAARDTTALLVRPDGPGLLVAESNWEDGATNLPALRTVVAAGASAGPLPPVPTAGPVALADFDGDGDVDLFVGGQPVPGRYPEATPSRLWRRSATGWEEATGLKELFSTTGLVAAALWTDLDGDGFPELVIASEWGPVRLFRNDGGRLAAWDPPLTTSAGGAPPVARLAQLTGWWTTLAGGDFDGDGHPDLLAGNWGLNSPHRASPAHPLRLHFPDLNGDGVPVPVLAAHDTRLGGEFPLRDLLALSRAVPSLAERFPTHAAFATASLAEVLGDAAATAPRLEAVWLASVLLLNRGEAWEIRPLPDEAQLSPVMGATVADFDGDGHEDAFLAQNFFPVQPTASRLDAGRGLLLRNRGGARVEPLPAATSGLAIWGEQRGAATGDFNGDGRPDLAVGQNGAETRLFQNAAARPGLRVRVAGPPGNPHGIGVALRIRQAGRVGPVRELRAGSGGLSQDSLVAVLARADGAAEVEARWPGGLVTTVAVPAGSVEVRVVRPGG
ncbi:MAG: FG-GAP-like repeat-containing protein [Limisphaerales bacterium]